MADRYSARIRDRAVERRPVIRFTDDLQDAVRRATSNLRRADRILSRDLTEEQVHRVEESILHETAIVRTAVYTQRQRRA